MFCPWLMCAVMPVPYPNKLWHGVLYFHSESFVLPLQMLNIQFVLSLPSCLTTPYLIWVAKHVETLGSYDHLFFPFAVFLSFTGIAFCLACSSTVLCFYWRLCLLMVSPIIAYVILYAPGLPVPNSFKVYEALTTCLLSGPLFLAK